MDLRRAARRALPAELGGLRALDVGTFDGFWAFEMERRGASVVALDLPKLEAAEWPARTRPRLERDSRELGAELGRGFAIAAEALGSRVERVEGNVYELDEGRLGGPVDFAFVGALLLHLRDPVRALERLAGVIRPGGELRVMEPFSLRMLVRSPRRPAARFLGADSDMIWWLPNPAATAAWLRAAGFEPPRRVAFLRSRGERELRQPYAVHATRRPARPAGG